MNDFSDINDRENEQRNGTFSIFYGRSELFLRVVSGLPLAIFSLFIAWLGGFAFNIFALFLAIAIFFEYGRICRRAVSQSIVVFSWIFFFLNIAAWLTQTYHFSIALGTLTFFSLLIQEMMVRRTGWVSFGFLYAFLPFSALVYLRGQGDEGFYIIASLLVFVWGIDTVAYVVGKIFSGPKLAPKISPGKTWSGFLGGLIGGMLVGWCVIKISGYCPGLSFWSVCIALAIFSQVGDLGESALKRKFGVKDSGSIIPGHGGVLDRVDGLVFVVVSVWLMMLLFSDSLSSLVSGDCKVDFSLI